MTREDPNEEIVWYIEIREPGLNWDKIFKDDPFYRAISRCISCLKNGSLKAKFTKDNNGGKDGFYSIALTEKHPRGKGPSEGVKDEAQKQLLEELWKYYTRINDPSSSFLGI
ncbi:hypothetical protein ETB97_006810 [Aspergillus alliaceus]|uniref:Uncharacterized protein n=1 Tax=Petromyces alliaceus TaxID=209559 RepID=A0A8H6AE42_PETAA|nr:hypothetical protein ETB97_006810 [Aspergillus burnettii]